MKKIYFILLALFVVITINKINAQTTIPNAGFETWTDANTATSWTSVNQSVIISTIHSLARSTDSHSGTYAAELKTQAVLTLTVPGICDLGTIDLTTQAVGGGTPFTGRPDTLKGYFKYTPIGADSMLIAIMLSKSNGGVRDTIAGGIFTCSAAVGSYTEFALPIYYNAAYTENPDTMNIILLSSATSTGGNGTTLLIDDLSLVYNPVGISENHAVNYRIYPNPASDHLTISTNDTKNIPVNVKIFNLTGQEVYNDNYLNVSNHNINLSSFKEGMYFVKISSNNINKTEKVLISHTK